MAWISAYYSGIAAMILVGSLEGSLLPQAHASPAFSLGTSAGLSWWASNANLTFEAHVPGEVHLDLIRQGILPEDLMYRYNERDYSWVPLSTWRWSTSFDMAQFQTEDVKDSDDTPWILHFEGINGPSTVTLNGQLLGEPHSAFIPHQYTLPGGLLNKPGRPNILEVTVEPPMEYAARQASSYPYSVPATQNYNVWAEPSQRQFIRKAGFDFGWDWGPAFIPMGIEGPVYLTKPTHLGRLTSLMVHQDHGKTGQEDEEESERVTLHFQAEVQDVTVPAADAPAALRFQLTVRDAQGQQVAHLDSPLPPLNPGTNVIEKAVVLTRPQLWWPVAMGSPYLYHVEVMLTGGVSVPTRLTKRFGVRTVELVQEPVEGSEGLSFYFKVNGVPVFVMGANLIPFHVFANAVKDQDMEWILDSAVAANFNMVRVWGGGIYQPARFYELCDEKGLMVWQEVMLACALYPRDQAFLELVQQEVEYQVKRLQSHPSIVLWGGNNENEGALNWFPESTTNRDLYLADYIKLYLDTVYPVIASLDPRRPWVDSSPSNQLVAKEPFVKRWGDVQDGRWGDIHFYDYYKDCEDHATFPNSRFVSEFGFQSLPSFETLSKVTKEEDWNRFSPLMEFRQRHEHGNEEIEGQIGRHYRLPPVEVDESSGDDGITQRKVFDDYLYLSQVQQAACYDTAISKWRRAKANAAKTMGVLYWQLNDVWQGPTWASIEYGGQDRDTVEVYLTNDMIKDGSASGVQGSLTLQLLTYKDSATPLLTRVLDIDVGPDSSAPIFTAPLAAILGSRPPEEVFLHMEFKGGPPAHHSPSSSNILFFTPLKDVDLPPAKVSITSVKWSSPPDSSSSPSTTPEVQLTLTADATAPFTLVEAEGIPGYFSDNAFLMLAGREHTLWFTPRPSSGGEGEERDTLTLEAFERSLRVRSMVDTYMLLPDISSSPDDQVAAVE